MIVNMVKYLLILNNEFNSIADLNSDNTVDILDIILIISIVLNT